MNEMIKSKNHIVYKPGVLGVFGIIAAILLISSCNKSESYSDMLKNEEKAVNWYLSNHRVCNDIPADGNFETGSSAPYYKMDDEGFVYMQVMEKGREDQKVQPGDKVYFMYSRQNIRNLWELGAAEYDSNEQSGTLSEYFFNFGDTSSTNGAFFGKGIQLPLNYLGYHSEVNLVLKSNMGFSVDQSECVPYILNVKYLKPEY